ncbi:MAG: class I SAM-dependent methyltransferase [Synergistaceae bacterium]|jgi:hypothetical protein|nr:class I SAM-dependent methyltransferase [Synergistaceae bacterium]
MKCLCCNSSELEALHIIDESFGKPLIQCKECAHIQLEIFPDAEELNTYYETTYSESRNMTTTERAFWKHYEERAISQLDYISGFLDVKDKVKSVCDLGCAYGVFLQKCSMYVQNVSGYELDPLCVEYCKKQGLNVSVINDYYSGNTHFDLTAMSHFLEHIPDIFNLLTLLNNRTRYLFIEIPATDKVYPFGNLGHVHFFNEKSIFKAIQSSGFEIINISRWGPSFNEYYPHYRIKKIIRRYNLLYNCCTYLREKWQFFKNGISLFREDAITVQREGIVKNKHGIWIRILAVAR